MNHLSNLIFSAEVVVPLLLLMLSGYIVAQKFNIIGEKTIAECNSLVFQLFLPILLFNNVRQTSIDNLVNSDILIFTATAITLCFLIVGAIVFIIEKENPKRGVMIQAICRSNYAIFGLPMIALLQPDQDVGISAIMVAVAIPMYNILSIIALTIFGTGKFNVKSIMLSLVKNPLIIGTLCGLLLLLLDIELPTILDSTFDSLGAVATPLALFMLGAGFDLSQLTAVGRQLVIVCLGRLALIPAVVLTVAVLLGYRGVELTCLMILFGAPTAAGSYVMAVSMGGDKELAGSSVVLTTMLSIFTMFVLIFALNSVGLI